MYFFTKKLFFLILLFFSGAAFAQKNGSASGKVINAKDKSAMDYASVSVKRVSDSVSVGDETTDKNGLFKVKRLAPGKYLLSVGFLGFKKITKNFEISAAHPDINLGTLSMEDAGVSLKEVEIKGEIPPIVLKDDTLEINAAALKVKENAVVEDLLKKVPGVQVSKDGSINAQGETIKKVRVDGKDFMGGDPLIATRNLPADMVDKLQIIDDLSDQAKFTGVDDGNRRKILNIVTKNGVKNKGWIGNNTAGYGTDGRYDVNLSVNRLNENQQMSLIGQFNNVNKENFGGGLGSGMLSVSGGGGTGAGISKTNAAGFNYADTYKNGTQLNASYFFNKTTVFNAKNTFQQNFIGSETNTTQNNESSNSQQLNHRLNFMLDSKIDSSTSFRFEPNIGYTTGRGSSVSAYNQNNTKIGRTEGEQKNETNSASPDINNNLLIRKKFLRRGRTLSLNVQTNVNNSNADNYNNNPKTITDPNANTTSDNLNQLNNQTTQAFNNTTRIVYTEPLDKRMNLEFNYENGYNNAKSGRFVYDFDNATQQYNLKNTDYSNTYQNLTLTNSVGMSVNGNDKKYNWNVGLAAQQMHRENDNLTSGNIFHQNFINLIPTANFRYRFAKGKRLTGRYRGNTNQPRISQIQPIPDNTNTQSMLEGNPNLKPSFSNNLFMMYNYFNPKNYQMFMIGGRINQTFNDFANNQRIITEPNDPLYDGGKNKGKIANGYVNVQGNMSVNAFGNFSLPILKENKLSFEVNAGGSYARSANITSNIENITRLYSFNNGYRLISNLDDLDLTASISGAINRATYTLGNNTNYFTLSPNIDISYMFPGDIRLQTDVSYNKLTGRGAGYDTEYLLVNAYLSRQFLNRRGTLKFSVNDLLNQNTGINRSASANSIIDQTFNVLKRYYMVSFTYSLTSIDGLKMPWQRKEGRRGGRPHGIRRIGS